MFSSVCCFSLKGEIVCYLCFKGAIEIYLIYLLTCYAILINFLSWVKTSMVNLSLQHIYICIYIHPSNCNFWIKSTGTGAFEKSCFPNMFDPSFLATKSTRQNIPPHGWTVKFLHKCETLPSVIFCQYFYYFFFSKQCKYTFRTHTSCVIHLGLITTKQKKYRKAIL